VVIRNDNEIFTSIILTLLIKFNKVSIMFESKLAELIYVKQYNSAHVKLSPRKNIPTCRQKFKI
jgi:hypothetical protein